MASPPTIVPEKVPYFTDSERLDLVDLAFQTKAYQGAIANLVKLLAEPEAQGRVFYGCTIVNSGVSAQLTLESAAGLACDSDGVLIVKPGGSASTIDLTTGAANYIHLYYTETLSDMSDRRYWDKINEEEDLRSTYTRVSKSWGIHVTAPNNNVPSLGGFSASATINGALRKLVPLYACQVDTNGAITRLTDYRRLYNIDQNISSNEGSNTFATTDTEVFGPFTLFRNMAALFKLIMGGSTWRDTANLGTLREVFTARNGQANLLAGIQSMITNGVSVVAPGLLSTANTWVLRQTFPGGVSLPAPTNPSDGARLDTVTGLLASINSWASRQTFAVSPTVPNPTAGTDAANRQWVESIIPVIPPIPGDPTSLLNRVNIWGARNTFTEPVAVPAPVAAGDAANRAWVLSVLPTIPPIPGEPNLAPYLTRADAATLYTGAAEDSAAREAAKTYAHDEDVALEARAKNASELYARNYADSKVPTTLASALAAAQGADATAIAGLLSTYLFGGMKLAFFKDNGAGGTYNPGITVTANGGGAYTVSCPGKTIQHIQCTVINDTANTRSVQLRGITGAQFVVQCTRDNNGGENNGFFCMIWYT